MTTNEPVIEARDLEKYFDQSTSILDSILGRQTGQIQAVDDVSLSLYPTESQGVIGESGCGKSTLLQTMVGLHEPTGGTLYYRGEDVSEFGRSEWKEFRRNVQIIFQDPFNSLDPMFTVREALLEPLKIHNIPNRDERIHQVLEQVELRPPDEYINRLPKQLSGGEKQRVSIARALSVNPDVIMADEPVSMLDVSTQASILRLLTRLREELDVAILYISHDLSTVSYICDEINVMYLGRIVESAPTRSILQEPQHPYTKALTSAIPIPDPEHKRERTTIKGTPRDPINIVEGCRFRDRCLERMDVCEHTPKMVHTDEGHEVACHLYYEHEAESPEEAMTDGDGL